MRDLCIVTYGLWNLYLKIVFLYLIYILKGAMVNDLTKNPWKINELYFSSWTRFLFSTIILYCKYSCKYLHSDIPSFWHSHACHDNLASQWSRQEGEPFRKMINNLINYLLGFFVKVKIILDLIKYTIIYLLSGFYKNVITL